MDSLSYYNRTRFAAYLASHPQARDRIDFAYAANGVPGMRTAFDREWARAWWIAEHLDAMPASPTRH
jgi:hypothetical protein